MRISRKRHYLLVAVLFCAALLSCVSFAWENQRRILAQNQQYAYDAAVQAASRVEDMLEARSTTLNLLSITVAETIREPWISTDFLKLLQETSVFDYVEFIDADGLNHNADGVTSDSTDRNNYLRGIQGETGFHVIFSSRITHETLVNFYAPVRYQGEIIGVLNGMFREESLRQAISAQFFGEDARSLICMADGTVISSYGFQEASADLPDALSQGGILPETAELLDAIAAREALCRTVHSGEGDICVSLVPVGRDWMLVQTFPAAVTRRMQEDAAGAGMRLELRLAVLFLTYVVYLLVTNLLRRRQLTSEKVRLSGIVEGLVPLFSRLVIIEADRQRYEYLKGAPPGLPAQGTTEELERYMAPRYLCDAKEGCTLPSLEDIQAALGRGEPFYQYEYRVLWDGERRENASALSLRQKDGVPVSLILAVQDVTALQRQKDAIEQTLRDAFHTAEDLSRAKSDFLARMSHDMRTPMNAVLGMASVALAHPDDAAQVRECLEKISVSGRQLLGLINEVLDMSKIESGGLVLEEKAFDLAEGVRQVLAEAREAAEEKGLRLDADVEPLAHTAVRGDPERFRQALRNLLDNAVEYTPSGGTVRFQARELPSRALKSGYYEFVVEDTGPGIDPALQPKVFEPFVRGESDGPGLGLPIARTIAELMGGEIRVESELGRGSRFTAHLFFKLEEEPAVQPEARPADAPAVTRHAGLRVLLADDIEINAVIVRKLLNTAGLTVDTAQNGAEAVDLLGQAPPGTYAMVFMDLQMPVMDGFQAARAIRDADREDLRRIPIVAVTANAFQEDVSRAMDAGMNDLVMKPVDLEKLLAALDRWLGPGKTE